MSRTMPGRRPASTRLSPGVRTRARTGARTVVSVLALGLPAVALAAPGAWADGPGYGGGADALSVSWSGDGSITSADGAMGIGVRSAGPASDGAAGRTLVVSGLGFRSRSPIEVQVGDLGVAQSRSDEVGQLDIEVPGARTGPLEPGTSVLAQGRAPSGTTRILVGAVPPLPSGTGPRDLVPWVALAGAGVLVLRRPRRTVAGEEPIAAADQAGSNL